MSLGKIRYIALCGDFMIIEVNIILQHYHFLSCHVEAGCFTTHIAIFTVNASGFLLFTVLPYFLFTSSLAFDCIIIF